ncbi:hypothetical protein [Streptomyces fagopyri]
MSESGTMHHTNLPIPRDRPDQQTDDTDDPLDIETRVRHARQDHEVIPTA